MIVLVLTAVPPGLRGDLTRWLIEVKPGVFTGRVTRRVREHLWKRVTRSARTGSALLIYAVPGKEQGYEVLTAGRDRWTAADFDGLTLMVRPAETVPPNPDKLAISHR